MNGGPRKPLGHAGQNVGSKRPLRPRDIWAIRFYLDEHKRLRDRALFVLAIPLLRAYYFVAS
jgi:hypothetical protein